MASVSQQQMLDPVLFLRSVGFTKLHFLLSFVSEEILGKRPSVVISTDDKHICYVTFNDTNVPLYEISLYGMPDSAYTRIQDIAYPKPGFPNPVINIYIYDVDDDKKFELKPPEDMRKRYGDGLNY